MRSDSAMPPGRGDAMRRPHTRGGTDVGGDEAHIVECDNLLLM
jgi:hypothetical protein